MTKQMNMKFLSQVTTIFLMAFLVFSCSSEDDCTTQNYYLDRDLDGFGAGEPTEACEAPSASVGQYVLVDGDTDDNNANINPDCNQVFYVDADGDGYGVGEPLTFCEEPSEGSYTDNGTTFDCDDNDPDVFPGNTEIMDNGIDDDCDPSTPDSVTSVLFEWETAVDNGDNFTETIGGITVAVMDDLASTAWGTPFINNLAGSSGLIISNNNALITEAIFTFSEPVDVNSILSIDTVNLGNEVFTFTPTGGSNSVVVETLDGGYKDIVLNWTNVTSFTVTKSGGGFGFDNLAVQVNR